MEQKRYKTKPLECWNKAKELRLKHYRDVAEAKEKGKLLVGGTVVWLALPAGLGDYEFFCGEPYAASMAAQDTTLSMECMEAAEARGFSRDMCAYMRNYWGSMYLNRFFYGGSFPKPDFYLQYCICDMHGKWYQLVAEHRDIPYFPVDNLTCPPGTQGQEARLQFLTDQLLEAIEWMEKITGKEYNDERLMEVVNNDIVCSSRWAEICLLNQATPAPLDLKTIYGLYDVCLNMRYKKECAEFYQEALEEVRDRVANQIAAVATERFRMFHDNFPIWSFLKMYKHLEEFGAACIGSFYSFGLGGALREREDGTFYAATIPQKGITFRNREEVVKFLAGWYLIHTLSQYLHYPLARGQALVRLLKAWHAQAMIMHLNRGCPGNSIGQLEQKLILQKAGIPVLTYEANSTDSREVDEKEILDRIDAFMESQGLVKLAEHSQKN